MIRASLSGASPEHGSAGKPGSRRPIIRTAVALSEFFPLNFCLWGKFPIVFVLTIFSWSSFSATSRFSFSRNTTKIRHTHAHVARTAPRDSSLSRTSFARLFDEVRRRRSRQRKFRSWRGKNFRARFRRISLSEPGSVPGLNGARRRYASIGTGPGRLGRPWAGQFGRNGSHGKKPLPQTKVANKSKWRLFERTRTHTRLSGAFKRGCQNGTARCAGSLPHAHTHTCTHLASCAGWLLLPKSCSSSLRLS